MSDIDESQLQATIDELRASAGRFFDAAQNVEGRAQYLSAISMNLTYSANDWAGAGSQAFQDAWAQYDFDSHKAVNALISTGNTLNKLAQKLDEALQQKRQAEAEQGLMTIATVGLVILDVAQLGLDPVTDGATVAVGAGAVAADAVDLGALVADADMVAESELAGIETTEVETLDTLDEVDLDFSSSDDISISDDPFSVSSPDDPGGFDKPGIGDEPGTDVGDSEGNGSSGNNGGGGNGNGNGSGSSGGGNDLPATTEESVTQKLDKYLLNPDHPVGSSKAEWFRRALGFTRENAADLAKQIVFDESSAVETAVTEYGTKFNQVISITGANGKVIDVLFAWIRNNDGVVRLITATPLK